MNCLGRVIAVATVLTVATACSREAKRPALEGFGVANGAVLVFDPATCEVARGLFRQLNALDARSNAKVVGVVLDLDTTATSLSSVAGDFGIEFDLKTEPGAPWHPRLAALSLRLPALIVMRYGSVVSVESIEPGQSSLNSYVRLSNE